jgi:hypothetical protein
MGIKEMTKRRWMCCHIPMNDMNCSISNMGRKLNLAFWQIIPLSPFISSSPFKTATILLPLHPC